MYNDNDVKHISKFLSLVLRHQPDLIGIRLNQQGFTNVNTLIEKINQHGIPIDLALLNHVVETNLKKRFAFNEEQDMIRASQGHSVELELGYTPMEPPELLYHGTAESFVPSIMETGLQKRSRQQVHLSADRETAVKVGQRHGKPFVFEVLAKKMFDANFAFYRADNGVWLTDEVPPAYLSR